MEKALSRIALGTIFTRGAGFREKLTGRESTYR
jgi:hypothetical protein